MSMVRASLHLLHRNAAPASWLGPDRYATDGRRLFRVISRTASGGDAFVGLEDCATLEARTYTTRELADMRLRPVHAGG